MQTCATAAASTRYFRAGYQRRDCLSARTLS